MTLKSLFICARLLLVVVVSVVVVVVDEFTSASGERGAGPHVSRLLGTALLGRITTHVQVLASQLGGKQ